MRRDSILKRLFGNKFSKILKCKNPPVLFFLFVCLFVCFHMKWKSLTLGGKGILKTQQPWLKRGAAYAQGMLLAAQHGACNSGVLLFVTKFSGFASFLPWSWESKSKAWGKLGLLDFQLKWRSVSQGTQTQSPRETDTKTVGIRDPGQVSLLTS